MIKLTKESVKSEFVERKRESDISSVDTKDFVTDSSFCDTMITEQSVKEVVKDSGVCVPRMRMMCKTDGINDSLLI